MLRDEPESRHVDDGVGIVEEALLDGLPAADVLDDGGEGHGEEGAEEAGAHPRLDAEVDGFAPDLGGERENGAVVEDDPEDDGDDDEGAEGAGGDLEGGGGGDAAVHGFGLEQRERALADVNGHHHAGGPDRNHFY